MCECQAGLRTLRPAIAHLLQLFHRRNRIAERDLHVASGQIRIGGCGIGCILDFDATKRRQRIFESAPVPQCLAGKLERTWYRIGRGEEPRHALEIGERGVEIAHLMTFRERETAGHHVRFRRRIGRRIFLEDRVHGRRRFGHVASDVEVVTGDFEQRVVSD